MRLFIYAAMVTIAMVVFAGLYIEEKTNNNYLSERIGQLRNSGTPAMTLNCGFATIPCGLKGGDAGVVACHVLPTNTWWGNLASNATNKTAEFYSNSGLEGHVNNATDSLFGFGGDDSNTSANASDSWSPTSWFGGDDEGGEGDDDGDDDDGPKIITKCLDPQKASYGDTCGACSGDTIPRACYQCPCTIENGPQLGEQGYWLYQSSLMGLHNHTVCATKERSVALQLEKAGTIYGEYNCVVC